MSSAHEDLMDGKPRYWGAQAGFVVDREDPEGLHRIRVEIPGLIDKTAWALPFGGPGSGSAQRGAWVVPDKGALVVVFFIGGDVERPIYTGGWWGTPDAGSEMPTEAKAVSPAEAFNISTIHETSRFKIWVDERAGKEQLAIQDKTVEDVFLQFDLTSGTITISAAAALILKAQGLVNIEGAQVTVNGRLVLPDSKGI